MLKPEENYNEKYTINKSFDNMLQPPECDLSFSPSFLELEVALNWAFPENFP